MVRRRDPCDVGFSLVFPPQSILAFVFLGFFFYAKELKIPPNLCFRLLFPW